MPQSYPTSAIATLLKLTERRVQQLVKDGILPRPVKGHNEPIACVHAYIDYLKKLITGGGELSLTDERTRLTKYQADLAQILLKEAQGEFVTAKKTTQVWGAIVANIRQKLLGLSSLLAPIFGGSHTTGEVKERIDSAIHEILNELTNPDPEALARAEISLESLGGFPAPAPLHNQRVGRRKTKVKPRIKRRAGKVANSTGRVPTGDDGRIQRPSGRDSDSHDLEPGGENRNRQ